MVEFTAEGTFAPALILRRGAYKYVYCETDPGMLYDLHTDPDELNNLCNDAKYRTVAAEMRGTDTGALGSGFVEAGSDRQPTTPALFATGIVIGQGYAVGF